MKNHITYILFAFLLLGTMNSCEDVIDVSAEEGKVLLVVDAWLTNLNEPQTIRLTNSQSYFESAESQGVVNAEVSIADQGSISSFQFIDQGNGDYTWTPTGNETLGTTGSTLELEIVHEGQTLTATTTVGRVPEIDEIRIEERVNEIGFEDGLYTDFIARDLVGAGDAYWIKTFKNDVFLSDPLEINIAYDAGFSDGAEVDGFVFIPPIRFLANPAYPDPDYDDNSPWHEGDVARIEIHSISVEAFKYMELARDQILNGLNGIFTEALANANGNIINTSSDDEVLGIFNVSAVSSLSRVMEKP